jgi:hypothetical protein
VFFKFEFRDISMDTRNARDNSEKKEEVNQPGIFDEFMNPVWLVALFKRQGDVNLLTVFPLSPVFGHHVNSEAFGRLYLGFTLSFTSSL